MKLSKTKKYFFLFFTFVILLGFPLITKAYGIGISPNILNLNEGKNTFQILNPNEFDVKYKIENKFVLCGPQNGTIKHKENKQISCTAIDNSQNKIDLPSETIIFVYTHISDYSEGIGFMPALGIRTITHNRTSVYSQQEHHNETKTGIDNMNVESNNNNTNNNNDGNNKTTTDLINPKFESNNESDKSMKNLTGNFEILDSKGLDDDIRERNFQEKNKIKNKTKILIVTSVLLILYIIFCEVKSRRDANTKKNKESCYNKEQSQYIKLS